MGVGAVLFSGCLSSYLNYAIMGFCNTRVGPVTTMAFFPVQSVVTPLLAATFLGATVAPETAAGGAGVAAGLFLVLWAKWSEGSPTTGVIVADHSQEAATLVLSHADVDALAAAAASGGGSAAAASVLPMLERSLSRYNLTTAAGDSVGGEGTALLASAAASPRARAAHSSASSLDLSGGARRRLPRQQSVVVFPT